MARPAAPRTAMIEVVSTPKLPSVTTTVSVRIAYLTSAARMGVSVWSIRLEPVSQLRSNPLSRREAQMPMMTVISAATIFSPYSVASVSVWSVRRPARPRLAEMELIEMSFIDATCPSRPGWWPLVWLLKACGVRPDWRRCWRRNHVTEHLAKRQVYRPARRAPTSAAPDAAFYRPQHRQWLVFWRVPALILAAFARYSAAP